jgi:excisionase family DNA binding protein
MLRENVELLTTAQVARRLKQSEEVVRRKARESVLPTVRLGPGPRAALRFPADALEAWLCENSASLAPTNAETPLKRRAPDQSRPVEARAHGGDAR